MFILHFPLFDLFPVKNIYLFMNYKIFNGIKIIFFYKNNNLGFLCILKIFFTQWHIVMPYSISFANQIYFQELPFLLLELVASIFVLNMFARQL